MSPWKLDYERAVYMFASGVCGIISVYLVVMLRKVRKERWRSSRSSLEKNKFSQRTLGEKLSMLNAIASFANAFSQLDFWGYENAIPFPILSALKATTASCLLAIPQIFMMSASKMLVSVGFETEAGAKRLEVASKIMIPLAISTEVGMSMYEVYLGNKMTGWEGAFSGSANVIKSAITGIIYVIYTVLGLRYGWLLTAALQKSSTVLKGEGGNPNRGSYGRPSGGRSSGGRPSRDSGNNRPSSLGSNNGRESTGVGGGAQRVMRRYFFFGGIGTAMGASYKAKNCSLFWGKIIYELPPCEAHYFDAVSVIFLACQVFWVVSQTTSYLAMKKGMEKKGGGRGSGKLINLRGA